MANELTSVNLDQLPSTQVGTDEQFNDIAKGTDFIGRLQLYTKGKAINKNLVRPGHYGIPESKDEVTDLGEEVDIIPLARRTKAIDMTDEEAIITSYDFESEEFKRIQEQSAVTDSHCMYGPSFLVYERSTARFLEFFCGTRSARQEAKKLYPYLPQSETDIARKKDAGADVRGLEAHGPIPVTLRCRVVEKRTYSWHVPVIVKCSTPFNKLPTNERIVKEITDFLTFKGDGVEKVVEPEKPTTGKARRR